MPTGGMPIDDKIEHVDLAIITGEERQPRHETIAPGGTGDTFTIKSEGFNERLSLFSSEL